MAATSQIIVSLLVMATTMSVLLGIRAARARRSAIATNAFLEGNLDAMPGLRDLEMAQSSNERIIKPLLGRLTGIGRILTPSRNIEQLQQDLIMAGLHTRIQVSDFIGMRVLSGAGFGLLGFVISSFSNPISSALWFMLAAFIVGLYLPNIWLRGRVSARQKMIQRSLPDALDMMSICVDAGLGFEAAIQKVAQQWDNELSLELRRVISEIRVGVSRTDALRHLVTRTGVTDIASFVAVLVQADNLGIAIRDVLHSQSVQMRVRRRQRAEEAAQKAPLKMLFPLVFFIFPAMFAVILGPSIPRLMAIF